MAYRKHVTRRQHVFVAVVALSVALIASCSGDTPPQPAEQHGQVLDQDTGQPIAGVIVVATYTGGRGFEGASSCNRVESAISDQEGRFVLPLDQNAGPLSMEGYHRNYRYGFPVRVPTCGINGDANQCQVWIDRRDDSDKVVSVVKEPTIYRSREAAAKAARYDDDLYLKRFVGNREDRISVLWGMQGATSCLAPPRSSAGLVPFLEAILKEEEELGDSRDSIRVTGERLQHAQNSLLRKK